MFTVHIEKSSSVMLVNGTTSEPLMTIGPRLMPLSTVPVQLLNTRPDNAIAPVLGVVWEYQYWSMSRAYVVSYAQKSSKMLLRT